MKNILDVCLSSAVWRSSWPRKCCHDYTSCWHSRGCASSSCSSSSFLSLLPPATASQRISPNKSKQFMLHMSLALALGIQMPSKYNSNVCVHIHLEFLCIFNIYLPEHSTHKIELDASKLQDGNLIFVGKIFTWPGFFFLRGRTEVGNENGSKLRCLFLCARWKVCYKFMLFSSKHSLACFLLFSVFNIYVI